MSLASQYVSVGFPVYRIGWRTGQSVCFAFSTKLPVNLLPKRVLGWQTSAAEYCEKIDDIYAKMFYLVDKVKPMNRRIVDEYLVNVWQVTMAVTFSMRKDRASDALKARFQHWVTAEEDRLKKNLEEIRYDIDSTDTVRLITGPGRIEMASSSCHINCVFVADHFLVCIPTYLSNLDSTPGDPQSWSNQ